MIKGITAVGLALLLCFVPGLDLRLAAPDGSVEMIPMALDYSKTEHIAQVVQRNRIISEEERLATVYILNHSILNMQFPQGFSLEDNAGWWLKITLAEPLGKQAWQALRDDPLHQHAPVQIIAAERANVLSVHTMALYGDRMVVEVLHGDGPFHAGERVTIYFTAGQSISKEIRVYDITDPLFQEYLCYETVDGMHYLVHYDGAGWG